MTEYDNTDRGVLYRNKNKKTEDHPEYSEKDKDYPDYSGSVNVSGTDLWLSGWIKTSKKNGEKFLSLSVRPKNDAAPKPVNKPVKAADPDEDIPF
jgi:hypothetical protein